MKEKAKQFIQNYKRDDSNVNVGWNDNGEEVTWYSPWLSPDNALRAVEIEREEMIDKACEWIANHAHKYIHEFTYKGVKMYGAHTSMAENLRKYMEE